MASRQKKIHFIVYVDLVSGSRTAAQAVQTSSLCAAGTASSPVPCGTRSPSDVGAAVQGKGCRDWECSALQPLLCLEVERKSCYR